MNQGEAWSDGTGALKGTVPQLLQEISQRLILDLEKLCTYDLSYESKCLKNSLCAYIVVGDENRKQWHQKSCF